MALTLALPPAYHTVTATSTDALSAGWHAPIEPADTLNAAMAAWNCASLAGPVSVALLWLALSVYGTSTLPGTSTRDPPTAPAHALLAASTMDVIVAPPEARAARGATGTAVWDDASTAYWLVPG